MLICFYLDSVTLNPESAVIPDRLHVHQKKNSEVFDEFLMTQKFRVVLTKTRSLRKAYSIGITKFTQKKEAPFKKKTAKA